MTTYNIQPLANAHCACGENPFWDPATGSGLLVMHLLPVGEYATFDHNNEIVACSAGAWRWLGWMAISPVTGRMTRYPAETFGPLPVRYPRQDSNLRHLG